MFAKRLSASALILLIAALLPAAVFSAQDSAALSQCYAWEQSLDLFVTGPMEADALSCKVSNQTARIVDSGLLADRGITVRTTILLDVSTSMPPALREEVLAQMNLLIENMGGSEQYRIVTFGRQVEVLQDFGADRYDLSNAVSGIEFAALESRIYDAIYHTVPELRPLDGEPCYYRTIVITDGVDNTAGGVTVEELYLKLQRDSYPIDVVAVSAAPRAEPDKELSALTRISGGRYFALDPQTDPASLWPGLSTGEIYWVRAAIPVGLLDGSTRQVNLTDGAVSLEFDVKVPVFDAPEAADAGKANPAKAPAAASESGTDGDQEASDTPGYSLVVIVGAGIGVLLGAAVIVTLVAVRRKKKKALIPHENNPGTPSPPNDKTEVLLNPAEAGGNPCIRLRNEGDAGQVWDVGLGREVVIGRSSGCHICIADGSVSREQCKLNYAGAATVQNLSKSNRTLLNGQPLLSPASLKTGDRLKCGRVTLVVDSLYSSGSHNVGELNKGTMFINV